MRLAEGKLCASELEWHPTVYIADPVRFQHHRSLQVAG